AGDWHGGKRASSLRGRSNRQRIAGRQRGLACAGAMLALGLPLVLSLALAGCGTLSDETAGRAFMAPGRYAMYPCANLEVRIKEVRERRVELEQLMARSSQSAGGEFVNAIAYRTEYVQTGGDLEELARA